MKRTNELKYIVFVLCLIFFFGFGNIVADCHVLFRVRGNQPTENPRIDWSPLSVRGFIVDTNKYVYFVNCTPDVGIAQWYCAPLLFKCTAIDSGCRQIFFLISFFFFFSLILEIQKLITLYHFARYLRIYHTIKP